jgi:diguanylate cyclase (GGDEF)-like protein
MRESGGLRSFAAAVREVPGVGLAFATLVIGCIVAVAVTLAILVGRVDAATGFTARIVVAILIATLLVLAVRSLGQLLRAVRERDRELAAVAVAGERLGRPMSSDALALEIASAARTLTGATFGRLVLTDPERQRILLLAASGPDGESVAQGPRAEALEIGSSLGLALEAGAPVRIGPDRHAPVALPSWYPVAATFIAVPLVIDGEMRGELVAAEPSTRRPFSATTERLLAIYAVQAAAVLKGVLLTEVVDEALEVAHAERSRSGVVSQRGDAVLDVARRLTETLDRATILRIIATSLNEHLETDLATIRVVDGDELLVVAAAAGPSAADVAALPRVRADVGRYAEVIRSGRTWSSEDGDAGGGWRGEVVAPLIHGGAVVGAISASTRGPRRWAAHDLDFVAALAAHASIAIHNAELYAKSEGLAHELQGIVEMTSDLARSLDSTKVADRIARHLTSALGAAACRISYWERDAGRLVALGHFPERAAWEGRLPLAAREVRAVIRSQVASTLDDGALVLLPLVASGESIGIVELRPDAAAPFESARLELGRTMANEAAMALENARLYEEARSLADRDQLTGFFNHRFLHQRLGEEILRTRRSRTSLGVLMLDLDDFKLVNDTFGHLYGDRVLAWAADVIRAELRLSDVAARYGGDEFAILLPDADTRSAEVVARRIAAAFESRPFELEGHGPLPISLSIGAASFPADGGAAQQVIEAADRALYRDKDRLSGPVPALASPSESASPPPPGSASASAPTRPPAEPLGAAIEGRDPGDGAPGGVADAPPARASEGTRKRRERSAAAGSVIH